MLKIFCFFAGSLLCWGSDWSSIYDSNRLEAEKPRLQTSVDYLVQNEITPFVPQQESTAFGLQAIDLPVNGIESNPLDFYAQANHIILPVRTLLFVEDLSRAYSWLWANHYTTKTIDEYLSMLRYRAASAFPDARYPAPLVALHVPETALADPHVVETAVRLRRTAYAFLILHEFAHIQLHHERKAGTRAATTCPSCGSFSEAQEIEADRFALDIMKNNSATPTGVLVVIYSGLFFEGGEAEVLHPVTPHRLDAMAHFMDSRVTEFVQGRVDRATAIDGIYSIGSLLEEGAEWLTVRGHQEELQQLAMKTDPNTLQPRPLPKTTR